VTGLARLPLLRRRLKGFASPSDALVVSRTDDRGRWWPLPTRRGIGAATVVVLLVGVGVTIYGAQQLRSSNGRSENQRLEERAQQTTALVTSVARTIQTVLTQASAVAGATDGNRDAFRSSVRQPLADTPVITNAVLVDLTGGRVRIDTVVGRRPAFLGICNAVCEARFRSLARTGKMTLVSSGTRDGQRVLGLASVAHPGGRYATYSEVAFPLGSTGSGGLLATAGPWLLLGAGACLSTVLALLVEGMRRRGTAVRAAERRYRTLVEELPLVTYVGATDEETSPLYVSPQIEELLGWPVDSWYADPEFLTKRVHADDRDRVLAERTTHRELGESFTSEYRLLARDGSARWVLDVAVIDSAGEGAEPVGRGFMLDITERKQAELGRARAEVELRAQAELNRHQALHDPLTDLPNRTLFRDRVEQEMRRGRGDGRGAAIILIDLDRFKEVNDTLGHQSGDALLIGLAQRLRGSIRRNDTVARLGGDEFGVLASGVDSEANALALAAVIHEALATPVPVGELELEVTASAGIALFPQHGGDVETLIRRADVALYRSKESRASTVYNPDQDHYSPTRLKLLTGLRRAIANREIVVAYQPQAGAASGVIESVEALVRWQHPELGLVMPDQFIPLAEHTDLIRPLTLYVLDTAVAQCRAWHDRGWDVGVAVNITGRDLLDASFPDDVVACLARHDVAPAKLELEITENTIFSDPQRALSVLTRLSNAGVRLAIDDFGAGNSSLGYLSRLPVDVLKIDKSFVLDMADGNSAMSIVRSTIELGHNLGLEVIAEGVETEERRRQLVEIRCDLTQGFLHGRAVPPDEVEKMFGRPRARVIDAA
jgi:diguanylate cyclase (GGDEF)-like protein/PAS domain S-box-containing protein